MKVKLIYNPVSGNGTFKNHIDYIIERFQQKGYQIEPYRIDKRENIDGMLSSMKQQEYKKILVAGGDGTINQVVNSLLKNNIDLPIGIFPAGTANDFAQYFNLPQDIEEIVEILLRDNYTLSDVGLANDKYFINVASLGVLIDISQKTNPDLKNTLGVLAYYLNCIIELPKLKTVSVRITSNEINYDGEVLFMLVMNGRSAGGFHKIAPCASINDGLLESFIFLKCPIYELASLFMAVINGDHINHPNVIHFSTKELRIESDSNVGTDIDGEKGAEFPLNIKLLPNKLKIITRYNNEDSSKEKRTIEFQKVQKTIDQISKGIFNEVQKQLKVERNIVGDIGQLVMGLPKHNSFDYINKNSLGEEYFKTAEKTLKDGYLYIALSSTGSAAGEAIAKVTHKHYSHASLSFEPELKTMVSYNGGENIYSPGLNIESLEFFNQKQDANILLYRLKATYDQKKKILDSIEKINAEGSSYNVLGLFLSHTPKDNIMVCSQFVYTMLKEAGLEYFDKKCQQVRPTDLIELDYERKLEFYKRILVKDLI